MSNNGYQPFMYGGSYGPAGNYQRAASANPSTSAAAHMNSSQQMNNMNFAGQATRRDMFSVRDCMFWPASVGPNGAQAQQRGRQQNSPSSNSFNGGDQFFSQPSLQQMSGGLGSSDPYVFHAGYSPSPSGEPMQQNSMQYPPGHVKAYISTPGEDGAGGQPIQIPCHLGGPGQVPMVPPQAPLGYRVMVPQTEPTPPLDFEIKQ